ncbi:MAG: S53 family peptidase [Terracidiphilus sp.]
MRSMSSAPLFVLASAVLCSMAGMAQQVAPTAQIVNRIDERNLVTLRGNTLPVANAKNDRGRVSPDLPMNDLVLVLNRSAQQQAAFDKFVASQYEVGSANYHQWLEPEEVGSRFGPAQSDIDTISNWLTEHGFSVGELSKDRMSLRFSGTAAQVQSAFHTEIHNIEVKGVHHIANMSDPSIPAALAPAVVGIKSLHNFVPKPMHRLGGKVELNRTTGKWQRIASPESDGDRTQAAARKIRAQFGTTDSYGDVIEDVAPYDFGAIYNVTPLWNASTPINGKGQTIAIAGTSKLEGSATSPTDVIAFRTDFGVVPNTPSFNTIVGNDYDPGICTSTSSTALCGIGDLTENSLDVEWSGAVAPGADLVLVVSGYNNATNPTNDPIYDSASYIVKNKTGNILNVSYGQCELLEGTAGNVSYYDLWQSAASEGISVFVSSGDSGSASCDDDFEPTTSLTPYAAEYGLTVSGLASTPYNTAVGGTDFNWCPASSSSCTAAPYWGTSNGTGQANALGYVPEIPWNDSCVSPTGIALAQYLAGELEVASPTSSEAACNFYLEYYQVIYDETEQDVSGFVNTVGGSGGQSNCVVNSTTSTTIGTCTGGATTTGTANGSIPLVNNGWPKPSWQANSSITGYVNDGVRDIPDVSFFAADGLNNSSYLICVSANGTCAYTGDADKTPLDAQEVGGTSVASPAMAGVMALINQKAGSAQGLANPGLYALAAKQTYSSCSTETVTASSSCYFNDIDKYTV